jgi:3-hydroxyisobutyrate dehydrogenase-like beta-hydroxyacid dehydrogenase
MTTAIIGTGGLGSVIARQLASGGETLRLSSADKKSARTLAARIGRAAVLAKGQSSGKVVAGWLPTGARLAMAFGTMVGGDLHDLVVGLAEARSLTVGDRA